MHIFIQLEGNGDCLFSNLVKQMIFQEDNGEKRYQACHLRRQAIVHFLCHHEEDEYKDWIIKEIKQLYRSGEEGGLGPFSVKLYLQHMVKMDHGVTI